MGALGATELLIIFAVLLLLVGAKQLPRLARSLGEAARELRGGLADPTARTRDDDRASGEGS